MDLFRRLDDLPLGHREVAHQARLRQEHPRVPARLRVRQLHHFRLAAGHGFGIGRQFLAREMMRGPRSPVPPVELGDAVLLVDVRLRVENLVAVDAPREAVVVRPDEQLVRSGERGQREREVVHGLGGWVLVDRAFLEHCL